MKAAAWVDGKLVDDGEPALRAHDHALVGDGLFEAIKVIDRRPFALGRHLRRLVDSAAPLGLDIDLDRVRTAISEVLATAAAEQSPCWLRVTVTSGAPPVASGLVGEPTVVAAIAPMAEWAPTAAVTVVPWRRNEHGATAGLKTISYAENAIALRHAHARGADEAVFANTAGDLCEGAGSNVFLARGDRLVTPPLSSGCLPGVTRELLLEWLPGIAEEDVPADELASAEEAFLTSTSRGVHPVAAVDGRGLAAAPGPLTLEAISVFAERTAESHDP